MTGPRFRYDWPDGTEREPTRSEIAELRKAKTEIAQLRHRVDVLERAARTACTVLKPYTDRGRQR